MTDFSGRWFTTFGPMLLEQRGSRVSGTYSYRGTEGRIEGSVRGRINPSKSERTTRVQLHGVCSALRRLL